MKFTGPINQNVICIQISDTHTLTGRRDCRRTHCKQNATEPPNHVWMRSDSRCDQISQLGGRKHKQCSWGHILRDNMCKVEDVAVPRPLTYKVILNCELQLAVNGYLNPKIFSNFDVIIM